MAASSSRMVVDQRFGRNIFQHIVALDILAHGGKHQRVARAVIGLIRAGHTPVPAFMLGHVHIKGGIARAFVDAAFLNFFEFFGKQILRLAVGRLYLPVFHVVRRT